MGEMLPVESKTAAPRRPVVLFVDDEAPLRDLALEILQQSGFDAIGAGDGVEALAQLKARPEIKAVITDIRMPKMSGAFLAATAQARNPSLKVALITAYPDDAFQLLELDQWPILLKPFDIERLPRLATEMCAAG
jgi:two-component system C4-dicarboxylate transport response regulator DctD